MNAKQFVQKHAELINQIKSLQAEHKKAMSKIPSVVTEENFREHDRLSRIAAEIEWQEAAAWEQLNEEIKAAIMKIPYKKARDATRNAILREAGLDG